MKKITPQINFSKQLDGLFDLSDQVVLVPGGYGGLGEAICWGLVMAGAQVIVAGRNTSRAEQLAASLSDRGHTATSLELDIKSTSQITDCVNRVAGDFGRIDILVNCIGIQREEPLLEVTEEAFDDVYETNLKSAMFLAQAVARHQVAMNSGRQVHLLSVRSKLGLRDRGYSAYCSTKGGLVMLIKQHAMELARHGITVNGVAPTFVYTEMIRHVMDNPEFRQELLQRIPLGRIADPSDVAGPVLFFCSPAAAFVTGQILYVDGGITASQ